MYGSLLMFLSNFVLKVHRFLRYSTCKYTVTLKPRLGSLKVIENDTIRSGTHDFLHIGLSRTVSEINGDFRRKSPIFHTPMYFASPLKGLSLELGIGARVRKKQNDEATRRSKKFYDRFSRLDTIPACDRHPATLP